MAWPFSRLRTYVATTTPSVKAADLNAIQDEAANNHIVSEPTPPTIGVTTPQMLFRDTAGNNRSLVDQHGFPGGSYDHFREEWFQPIVIGASFGAAFLTTGASSNPNWEGHTTANAALLTVAPSNTYPAFSTRITPGTANTNEAALYLLEQHFPADISSIILDLDVQFSNNTATNEIWNFGFSDKQSGDPTASQTCNMWAVKTGTWQSVVQDNGVPAYNDTTIAIDTNWHRLHIEFHGKNTPIGVSTAYSGVANAAKCLLYLDGANQQAYSGAGMPAHAFNLMLRGYCTGAATATCQVGPLRLTWNRYASIDAL